MNLDSINMLQIITKILIIFLVLPIHECAHAWAAHKMGDETAAYSRRLTLNPLAHIDITWSFMSSYNRIRLGKACADKSSKV